MDNIKLYEFYNKNDIEFRWEMNDNILDVIFFVPCFHIEKFNQILPSSIFDEEGIACRMKDGYFAFWMNDICNYCGINIEEVFPITPDKERLILLS